MGTRGLGRIVFGLVFLLKLSVVAAAAGTGLYTTDDNRRVPIPEPDDSLHPVLVIDGATLIDGRGGGRDS